MCLFQTCDIIIGPGGRGGGGSTPYNGLYGEAPPKSYLFQASGI